MPHTKYCRLPLLPEILVGQDLVLGVHKDDLPSVVLVTQEQARRYNLPYSEYNYADACLSLSPIRFSEQKEFDELDGLKKKTKKRKANQRADWRTTKIPWSKFEHSRTLLALLQGQDRILYDVSSLSKWSKARFFSLAFNHANLKGHEDKVVDLAYSEYTRSNSILEPLQLVSTTRYVLRRTMASDLDDPRDELKHTTAAELPEKLREFINQSSADTPLVLFTYESDRAKAELGVRTTDAMSIDDGVEYLLYPFSRNRAVEDRRRTPYLIFVDLQSMAVDMLPHKDYPNLKEQAKDLRIISGDPDKNTNAAADSRLLMQMWLSMAGGKQLRAQKEERRQITAAILRGDPVSVLEDTPHYERAESEDPNDYRPPVANAGKPKEKVKHVNPYELSDSSDEYR